MIAQALGRMFAPLLAVACALAFLVVFVPQSVSAVDFFGTACNGGGGDSAACSGKGQDTITGTEGIILRAAGIVAVVASVAAVIGMMIAAMMFITANGDSSKVSQARQMIIYIVIGLITIFAARTIIVFIVNNV